MKTSGENKSSIPHASDTAMNKARANYFAAELDQKHESQRQDGGEAFVRESDGSSNDDFATEMAQDFLIGAETGREVMAEASDHNTLEESGGPFVITAAGSEFAEGVDASNPIDAEPAAFPTAMRKPS